MVVDALSRKAVHVAHLVIKELELIERFIYMKLQAELGSDFIRCSNLTISNAF